jgi:hypothetical protein
MFKPLKGIIKVWGTWTYQTPYEKVEEVTELLS